MSEKLIVEYDERRKFLIRMILLLLSCPAAFSSSTTIGIDISLLTISQHPPQQELPCLFVSVVDAPNGTSV